MPYDTESAWHLMDRLAELGDAADWYEALLMAGLDETGHDLAAAIELADKAFAEQPTGPEGEEDGEGGLFEAEWSEEKHKRNHGKFSKTAGAAKDASAQAAAKQSRVPEEEPSTKAARAKAAHKMVDKTIQRYAEEHNEPHVAAALGGVSFPDSEPMDIAIAGNKKHAAKWQAEADRWHAEKAAGKNPPDKMDTSGQLAHAVEMKTVVDNSNGKITMDSYSQIRKLAMEKERGTTFHTLVVDDSKVFNAKGEGKHDDSKRRYFYRRGVAGSARYERMHEAKDMAEVKRLMTMPEDKLPAAAARTDGGLRAGKWKAFHDAEGKGFKDQKSGRVVRAKK